MAYEHKTNTGTLFVNDYKSNDNHPDFKGTVNVEGKIFEVAAWKGETTQGKGKLSITVKAKIEETQAPKKDMWGDNVINTDDEIRF